MALYADEEWLTEYYKRRGITPQGVRLDSKAENQTETKPKRKKYGNVPTVLDGKRFDSKHEAAFYQELMVRVKADEICGVTCQQEFLLPGGVKYIADFVALNRDGTYTVYDAKSIATKRDKVYRLKKRLLRECLGIEIQEV